MEMGKVDMDMVLEAKRPSVMHFLFVFYSFFFLLFFKLLIVSNESIWVSVVESSSFFLCFSCKPHLRA